MAMHNSIERLKKEFEENFEGLNYRQIWFIVKIAKGTRLYCRHNTAFNNYFNGIFEKIAKFEQIEKQKPDGTKYQGLRIKMKQTDGTEMTTEGDDEQ